MSITIEELQKIKDLDIKKHVQIVDGYIASGLELDDITIHFAVDQERVVIVLHSYGFGVGSQFGDSQDARRKYKGLPFHLVEEYLISYYPGFLSEPGIIQVTLEDFLEERHPDWKHRKGKTLSSMYSLSQEEMQGESYFHGKTNGKKSILSKLFPTKKERKNRRK